MRLFAYRPGSFLRLVWIGFFCVTLPLLVALLTAGVFAGRFARRAGEAVQQASRVASETRLLHDQVVGLERRARQLQVLEDEQLFRDYRERREAYAQTLERVRRLLPGPEFGDRLGRMAELERGVFEFLTTGPHRQGSEEKALGRFVTMNALAQEVVDEGSRVSLEEAEALQGAAASAQRLLLYQASALVPVTVLVSWIFASLLARPVRQIDRSIQTLGAGDFEVPIRVRGPRDLEFLGERLDWLRRRLLDLQVEKARFLAHMSHELKTPLTAIREGAELMREGVLGRLTGEQREVAGILRANAVRLQQLIENLLRFSRDEARDGPPGEGSTDLADVAQAVLADHKLAAAAKGLSVAWEGEPLRARGDRSRLRVVMDNLISNAVKFTPEGGAVAVRVFREESEAVIEVRDTGPGVPSGERGRVFEPFFQGSARGSGAVQGSGLGLSIVAEYVTALGGRVEILDPEGPGALFRVRLPAAEETE
jgi:two-component system sensor histidine kinase GlrK